MEKLDTLKLQIKKWEHEFQRQYERAPGKADIKENPQIAAKYKQYQQLKQAGQILSQKPDQESNHKPSQKFNNSDYTTPKKISDSHQTCYDSPYNGNSAKRQIRHSLGPTPQADGRVMALFDIISRESPIKSPRSNLTDATSFQQTSPQRTPTRVQIAISSFDSPTPSGNLHLDSPSVLTPTKDHIFDLDSTPISYFNSQPTEPMATPSPLQRPKPVTRGLSLILQELKTQREAAFQEEESILDEIEREEMGRVPTNSNSGSEVKHTVTAEESHLGEVQEGDIETAVAEAMIREETRLRSAKYRKLSTIKRSTRRVVMRPAHPTQQQEDEFLSDTSLDDSDDPGYDSPTNPSSQKRSLSNPQSVDIEVSKDSSTGAPNSNQSKSTKRKPIGGISNNFQRLKIKRRAAFRGGRIRQR
ncbi:DNA replication/checkpoint protein [Lipomyces oligophaga]|uniref:DNA replication/checkpoint protein n=1 Tax=Lipomyces oligophaga TaxID=45792 RepID=UPI0034CF0044